MLREAERLECARVRAITYKLRGIGWSMGHVTNEALNLTASPKREKNIMEKVKQANHYRNSRVMQYCTCVEIKI